MARVYYNYVHSLHVGPTMHPEAPIRVETIMEKLKPHFERGALQLKQFSYPVEPKKSKRISYWNLKDGDTYKTAYTEDILKVSRDMIKTAVDDLISRDVECAFVLCRPPGHHAAAAPAGFCHQNNVWTAIQCFEEKCITDISIYDWDAHHGDGTEALITQSIKTVRFVSTHAYGKDIYPGTGESSSDNRIRNIPLNTGTSDILTIFHEQVMPFLGKPSIFIISAGYDGHIADPMDLLAFTTESYKHMSEELRHTRTPILFLLEGGYNPVALGECVEATLEPWFPPV